MWVAQQVLPRLAKSSFLYSPQTSHRQDFPYRSRKRNSSTTYCRQWFFQSAAMRTCSVISFSTLPAGSVRGPSAFPVDGAREVPASRETGTGGSLPGSAAGAPSGPRAAGRDRERPGKMVLIASGIFMPGPLPRIPATRTGRADRSFRPGKNPQPIGLKKIPDGI